MFVCLILMGGIEAAKLHKTVPSGLLPASGVQAAGGDETIEPDVIAIIDAQNTDEFKAGVQDLAQLFLTGANLTGHASMNLNKGRCGWRCPGCCVDKVLPKPISCAVQRAACSGAASACDAACTTTAGACVIGCEAGKTVCLARVCT